MSPGAKRAGVVPAAALFSPWPSEAQGCSEGDASTRLTLPHHTNSPHGTGLGTGWLGRICMLLLLLSQLLPQPLCAFWGSCVLRQSG